MEILLNEKHLQMYEGFAIGIKFLPPLVVVQQTIYPTVAKIVSLSHGNADIEKKFFS